MKPESGKKFLVEVEGSDVTIHFKKVKEKSSRVFPWWVPTEVTGMIERQKVGTAEFTSSFGNRQSIAWNMGEEFWQTNSRGEKFYLGYLNMEDITKVIKDGGDIDAFFRRLEKVRKHKQGEGEANG